MTMAELIDAVGEPAARALCDVFGGTRLYLPTPAQWQAGQAARPLLAQGVPPEIITALAAWRGGESVDLPRLYYDSVRARHAAIRQRRAQNATVAEIAREFRLTMRQVYNILAADDAPSRSLSLFGEPP